MAFLSMPALIYSANHLLFRAYKIRQSPEEGDEEEGQKEQKKGKKGGQKEHNIRQTYPEDESGPGRTVQITIR